MDTRTQQQKEKVMKEQSAAMVSEFEKWASREVLLQKETPLSRDVCYSVELSLRRGTR